MATRDFLPRSMKIRNVDELMRDRHAFGDITNVFQTDSTAADNAGVLDRTEQARIKHPVNRPEFNGSNAKSTAKAPCWTTQEDCALRKAVEIHHARNWKVIAEAVPNRTDVQCLHRWQKSLQEDDRMIELVQMFGKKRWAAIARCLPGRNGKQCRERWCNHLDPKISRDAWTEAEDMLLFLAHSKHGNKWAEISKLLPGRSDNGIKNRWNTSVQKRARQMAKYTMFLEPESSEQPSSSTPTASNEYFEARRDSNAQPSSSNPASSNLAARRTTFLSPTQPAPPQRNDRRASLTGLVKPTLTRLEISQPTFTSDYGRHTAQPSPTQVDARQTNFTPSQGHHSAQPSPTYLEARRPNFTPTQGHHSRQPSPTTLDARRIFTPVQGHHTAQPSTTHARRASLLSPVQLTSTQLDAKQPNFVSPAKPAPPQLDEWRVNLKGSVYSPSTHLSARQANFTPGYGLQPVQVEVKGSCEICLGFKSYSTSRRPVAESSR